MNREPWDQVLGAAVVEKVPEEEVLVAACHFVLDVPKASP